MKQIYIYLKSKSISLDFIGLIHFFYFKYFVVLEKNWIENLHKTKTRKFERNIFYKTKIERMMGGALLDVHTVK